MEHIKLTFRDIEKLSSKFSAWLTERVNNRHGLRNGLSFDYMDMIDAFNFGVFAMKDLIEQNKNEDKTKINLVPKIRVHYFEDKPDHCMTAFPKEKVKHESIKPRGCDLTKLQSFLMNESMNKQTYTMSEVVDLITNLLGMMHGGSE